MNVEIKSGLTMSSLSTKHTPSKVPSFSMASSAAFLADDTPPFFLWMTTNRESFWAYSSRIAPELSVEPSSTVKTLKF